MLFFNSFADEAGPHRHEATPSPVKEKVEARRRALDELSWDGRQNVFAKKDSSASVRGGKFGAGVSVSSDFV